MEASDLLSGSVDLLLSDYKFEGYLGKGSYSVVKKAKHLTSGRLAAIKILNLQQIKELKAEDHVKKEISIMEQLENPHIIKLYEVINTPSHIYLVMEYAPYGDFFDYLSAKQKLKENEARRLFQQLISGVEYCHGKMVAHRDLKLENLLLDENHNLKISDFGLSAIMKDDYLLNECCGSPNYAAPEVLSKKWYRGPQVDVWSCGIILYAILCGEYPFDDDNPAILYKKIRSGCFTCPQYLSRNAQDLIKRMLTVDPTNRLTIPEICKHPWFTG